jgi:carbonic anhydrase
MTLGLVHSPTPAALIKHSRRKFVRGALAGAAAVALADQTFRRIASAQTALSPEAAVQQLIDGNRRFAEGRMTSFDEDLSILKAKTVEKQEPFAAVLSCADSRVPVEFIFDQSIGHVFVTRVAGNIATSL